MHSPNASVDQCDDRNGLADLLIRLASMGQRTLDLLLHRAEPKLMDHPRLLEELRRLALAHHRNHIRLCVFEAPQMARDCPRLVDLVQRMPSRCEIRTPGRQHREIAYDFALADQHHMLYRPRPSRYEAQLWLDDPAGCLARGQEFEDVWQQAEGVSELRRLDL